MVVVLDTMFPRELMVPVVLSVNWEALQAIGDPPDVVGLADDIVNLVWTGKDCMTCEVNCAFPPLVILMRSVGAVELPGAAVENVRWELADPSSRALMAADTPPPLEP